MRFANRSFFAAIVSRTSACSCILAAIVFNASAADGQKFIPLDFSAFATKPWSQFRPWTAWNGPAPGLQQFDGVPFQIDAVIQFRSATPTPSNDTLPTRVRGIKVGHRMSRLHILHCSEFGAGYGDPAVRVVLHGADGKEDDLVIRYGLHFQDWNHLAQEQVRLSRDTSYAWRAPPPPRFQDESPFVTTLWHTALANPRPDVEVASIEFRSLFSRVRYTLIAITAETGPSPDSTTTLRKPEPMLGLPSIIEPRIIHVKFLDADDSSPIPHAFGQVFVLDKEQMVPWQMVETDDQGTAGLDFPVTDTRTRIEIIATAPKHITQKVSFSADQTRTNLFKLRRGRFIGGKVIDETGRPVVGAIVTVAGSQTDASGETFMSRWPDAVTDQNGIWSLNCAPPDFSRLIITVRNSKFLPPGIYEQDDAGSSPFSFQGKMLAEGKAVFRVKAGIALKGLVVSEKGPPSNAVAALVYGDTANGVRLVTRPDKQGRFAFSGLEPGTASLLITCPGFAPALQKIEITTNTVEIKIERDKNLEVIVQDESGQPLPQTLFQMTSWKGEAWFEHFGYSDSSGKFRWDSAPPDSAVFNIFHPGFRVLRDVELAPGGTPKILQLHR